MKKRKIDACACAGNAAAPLRASLEQAKPEYAGATLEEMSSDQYKEANFAG